MEIKFPCPHCNVHISVDETAAGREFPCPSCGNEVQVPSSSEPHIPASQETQATPPPSGPPPFRGAPEASTPPGPPPFKGIVAEQLAAPMEEQPGHAPRTEETGRGFSAGFLAGLLDRRLIWLKSRAMCGAFNATARKLKLAGDIALLVIISVWLGMSIYQNVKAGGDDAPAASTIPQAGKAKAGKAKAGKADDKAGKAKAGMAGKANEKTSARAEAATIFAKQIEPVLKEKCYSCHGPEKQEGKKLNLTLRAEMNGQRGILAVIDTAMPDNSELLQRVKDKDDPMPPEGKGEMLKPSQVDALAKWIAAGAPPVSEAGPDGAPAVSTKTLVAIGKAVLTGVLAIFLVLFIHYLTGRFFDANESIIAASTPSRISTATVPNALAVLFWIASLGVLAAAVVKAGTLALEDIKLNWMAAIFNLIIGGLLFALCLALARLFVADDFLNVKASKDANAGDEALGVFSLFIKVGLKMAPVFYGLCLALGAVFFLLNQFWATQVPPAEKLIFGEQLTGNVLGNGISLAGIGIDTTLPGIIILPVKAYFYFLAAFLVVEVARAVLNISRRLGAK